MADIVLIHGTTQSPAGWDRLAAALAARGHRAHAIDLPSSSTLDADAYAALARGQVPPAAERPVVVAHSGAGLLLPAAARLLGARRQVWLGAIIPDGLRSLREEVVASPATIFNEEWVGRDPTVDPVLAAYFLFHDCDLATLQWALGTVRAFRPQLAYGQAIPLWAEIPSTYVVCTRDRTIRPDWQRREARLRLAADIVEIEAGHCPHVSLPDTVAAIVAAAAS